MVRIDGKAFWLLLPALTDVRRGGEPFQRFEPLGEVIGHQQGVQMCLEVVMSLVMIVFHGGVFAGTLHAFDVAIGPGMMGLRQPRVGGVLLADAVNDLVERGLLALPVGELHAVVRQDGVDLVGHGSDQAAQEWRRHGLAGLWVQLGLGTRARAVDGHEQIERAFFGVHLGDIAVEVSERVGLEGLCGGLTAFGVRQATDAMPLQAAMPRRAGQVRERRLQRIQAVIQRQQRMLATRDDQRGFLQCQDGGAQLLRPHRRIVHVRPLFPLGHSLWIEI
jgi:hypothetical protein